MRWWTLTLLQLVHHQTTTDPASDNSYRGRGRD